MGNFLQEVLIPGLMSLVAAIVAYFLPVILNKVIKNDESRQVIRDFGIFIEGFGQRARTKYLEELMASKKPDSDGGVEITAAEISKLRQEMYDLFMDQAPVAIRDYALKLGSEVIKGFIGKHLEK